MFFTKNAFSQKVWVIGKVTISLCIKFHNFGGQVKAVLVRQQTHNAWPLQCLWMKSNNLVWILIQIENIIYFVSRTSADIKIHVYIVKIFFTD